jgi:hypothetical protein
MCGSKQVIPNQLRSCFAETCNILVDRWNKANLKHDHLVEVDFVSSNSISTLWELMCFYNNNDRGKKLLSGEVDIPWDEWPSQDCIHGAVLSWGHSFSRIEDFLEMKKADSSEFLITVSENVSELINEALFLPHSDGDFHSPIWLCINLPEQKHAGLRRKIRTEEAKKRTHDSRKERQRAKVREARTSATESSQPQVSTSASSSTAPSAKPKTKGKSKGKSK